MSSFAIDIGNSSEKINSFVIFFTRIHSTLPIMPLFLRTSLATGTRSILLFSSTSSNVFSRLETFFFLILPARKSFCLSNDLAILVCLDLLIFESDPILEVTSLLSVVTVDSIPPSTSLAVPNIVGFDESSSTADESPSPSPFPSVGCDCALSVLCSVIFLNTISEILYAMSRRSFGVVRRQIFDKFNSQAMSYKPGNDFKLVSGFVRLIIRNIYESILGVRYRLLFNASEITLLLKYSSYKAS